MKVFLSWSGNRSKQVALALREWLQLVIQNLKPWCSDVDIEAGDRWGNEIATELQDCNFGIVCLTVGNLHSLWLHFEAGALSKSVSQSAVVPFLLDLEVTQIPRGPLSQFQSKKADKTGTLGLLEKLNSTAGSSLSPQQLATVFERLWPDLESKLTAIPAETSASAPQRATDEILEELVESSRGNESRLQRIEAGLSRLGIGAQSIRQSITDADVAEALTSIPYLRREEVEARAGELRNLLNQVGIRTRTQLFQVVTSRDAISWVEELYKRELLRPVDAPLDPAAVAVWVGLAVANGLSDQVKQHITNQILNCPEYREKHPPNS